MDSGYREEITSRHPAQEDIDAACVLTLAGKLEEACVALDSAAVMLYHSGRIAAAQAIEAKALELRRQIA